MGGWAKHLAFCTTEHAEIQWRNYISVLKCNEDFLAFLLGEIGYIQAKLSRHVNPYLPIY